MPSERYAAPAAEAARRPFPGWRPLEWLPPETLEDGMEAREIVWHGRRAGMAVHVPGRSPPRTLLLGPIGEALGEPPGWLDGLDAYRAMDTIEEAASELAAEELEEALAAHPPPGPAGERWPPRRPPGREGAWQAAMPPPDATA